MNQASDTATYPSSNSGRVLLTHRLPQLAFIGVVAYFYWFVYSHAINVPFEDSIYDFLQFIIFAQDADGLSGAFAEWYKHYNDHRTNASRLMVLGAFWAQSHVDFQTLSLLANLSLLLILGLFYLAVKQEKYRWVILLCAALLLLHIRTYTIVLWEQATFAYCWVFTYAFACFFALYKVTPIKFVLAAIFCTLASFTFAAGQAVWAMGLAMLLHQLFISKETSGRYAVAWIAVAIAMLLAWRVGFESLPEPADWQGSEEQIRRFFPDLLINPTFQEVANRFASFFFVILGSAFYEKNTLLAGITGVAMFSVLTYLSLRDWKQADHRLALCCWFVVASAAAITVGRASVVAPDYVLDTRYSFLSVLLASTLTTLALSRINFLKSRAVYIAALFAAIYCVWSYQNFSAPLSKWLDKRYTRFNNSQYIVFGYSGGESAKIVNEAISRGIYRPPCRPLPACDNAATHPPTENTK